MRYVDELLRNAVAELRWWAERRAARRSSDGADASRRVGSPLVGALTRPVGQRVGRRERADVAAGD